MAINFTPWVDGVTEYRASHMNGPLTELMESAQAEIDGKAATGHLHDDRYYTETELNTSGSGGQVHWTNVTNKPTIGTGDVIAPAANSNNYVPQWDGANSKTLKDGVLLGDAATKNTGTGSGDVAVGNHGHTQDGAVGFAFEAAAKPAASGSYSMIMGYAMTVPANCSGSGYFNAANPASEQVISIRKNDTEFATLTVATNGNPTWAGSQTSFAAGDRITLQGFPSTQDATWAGVLITIRGTRSI